MKFNIIILLLLILLLSINVLAEEIILPKQIYSPFETLQADISLNFLPVKDIQPNQIFLFDSSGKSYYIAPFLTKFDNNNYYIYFDLPYNAQEDNYTLRISKITYILEGVLIEKTITKEFSIVNDTYMISINPALVNLSSTSQSFDIKAFNHGNSTMITIKTSSGIIHPYEQPQQIGNSRSFRFTANSKSPQEEVIFFYDNKNYTIPVYTPFKEQNIYNQTNITQTCTNECSTSGSKQCTSTTSFKTCGNYDNDSCLELSNNQYCSSGYICSNGQCIISQNQTNIIQQINNQTNLSLNEEIKPITLITNLSSITKYIEKTEILQGPLPIRNNLNKSITINFELIGNLNEIVYINSTSLKLNPNEIKEQYFIVNQNKNAISYEYFGNITITTLNYSIIFPMTFYVTQQIEEHLENITTEEIHETLFNESEQEIKNPFENKTITPDIEPKKESNNILLIAIILIILIIILALIRKKHRERTFNDYLKTIERK